MRDSSGELRHDEFLNDDADDPRERFTKSLLDTVPPEGTIFVYSAYEQTVMKRLAEAFFNFIWMLEKKPGAFDLEEAKLYDDFVMALRKRGKDLPKYLTRVHSRFRQRLRQNTG